MVPSWQHYGTYDESAHPDLWNGVVGYWAPCLGPTGLRLHDVSRYNNWGTLTTGAASWVLESGVFARRQTNEIITCGDNTALDFVSPFSAAVWARNISVSPDGGLFAKIINANFYAGWMMWINGGKLVAYWNSGGRATGATTITALSRWVLFGICWTGTTALVYIDGKQDSSAAYSTPPNAAGSPLVLSAYQSGREASGDYSDFMAWNRCLTANEWHQLYQLGRGGMLQRKPRRRAYSVQAGFRAYYATQRNAQLIGGGLK
jgi:hypothetical protein